MAGFPGLVVADRGSEFYFHMWPGHRLCIKALRAQWGTYQTQPGPGIAVNRHEEMIQQTNASSSRPFHPSLGSLLSHRRVHFFFFFQRHLTMSERVLLLEPRQIFTRRHGPERSSRRRSRQPRGGKQTQIPTIGRMNKHIAARPCDEMEFRHGKGGTY